MTPMTGVTAHAVFDRKVVSIDARTILIFRGAVAAFPASRLTQVPVLFLLT